MQFSRFFVLSFLSLHFSPWFSRERTTHVHTHVSPSPANGFRSSIGRHSPNLTHPSNPDTRPRTDPIFSNSAPFLSLRFPVSVNDIIHLTITARTRLHSRNKTPPLDQRISLLRDNFSRFHRRNEKSKEKKANIAQRTREI